ncbi:hypothetical protein [Bifidobacterium breve]|uniref:hypothetical protein n=1 Tax=Bifidobacterium breve TaxID=1685 RepID=UPI0003EFC199|nr:hypothetical protein [Bifidobacterium breve]AHJ19281.1 hypothetical protein B7019_1001 [Bifidobacterium breve JCM 7019]
MTGDIDSVLSSSEVIPDDVTTDVPPENEQDDATQVSDEFQKLELQEAKTRSDTVDGSCGGGWALVRTEIDTMRVAKHN